MRSRVLLPALSAALVVAALLAWGIPWATKDRPALTSTPTPTPFSTITPIKLEPGEEACENLVAFAPETRTATVLTTKGVEDGPPLVVTARAAGYASRARIEGGYGELQALPAQLEPPSDDALGKVCVRNAGDRKVAFQGTTEGRIQNRSSTGIDGEMIEAKLTLLLGQGANRSLADRPGQILERIAAFRPPIVNSWTLAILALLVVVGVPALVVYAIARGIADESG